MSISFFGTRAAMNGPNFQCAAVRGFVQTGYGPVLAYPYQITGITYDSTGVALPSCKVQIYRTADDSYVSDTTSDATTGYYAIPASNVFTHYLVAYLVGSPDVAGTTVNTLTGT